MKVLKLEPGEHPKELEITDSLESMQSIVGGIIQAIYPFEDTVALICNEEGKLLGLSKFYIFWFAAKNVIIILSFYKSEQKKYLIYQI